MIINIRGTNGSGKTSLARKFIANDVEEIELAKYERGRGKVKVIPGMLSNIRGKSFIVVGDYTRPQGGLDSIPTFKLQQQAILNAIALKPDHVIFEGILCSTVFGAWAPFMKDLKGKGLSPFIGYLDTPLDICIQRIYERQQMADRIRQINTQMVADKMRGINATVGKFESIGVPTCILEYKDPLKCLEDGVKDRYGKGIW